MRNSKTGLVVLLLSILCWSIRTEAQITPSADTYTNSAAPTTNYGAKTLLDVDGATQATYIQFDLSSVPTGAAISQATLKLYVNAVSTAGSFELYSVNGTWSESKITYDLAPALGSVIDSNVPITTADKNQYILIPITSTVQGWVNTPSTNNGIALVAIGSFNATFDSKESTTTSHPPELDVVFAGDGTITGVTTASGSGLIGGGTGGALNLSLTNTCSKNQVLQWSGSAWACTSAGTGTITGVTAGTDLTGGGTSGNVTLKLNTSLTDARYAQLNAANIFTGNQSVSGNVSAEGSVSGTSFYLGTILFAFGNPSPGNAFLGFAGNPAAEGAEYNTAVGQYALNSNSLASGTNTAVGALALGQVTTGAGGNTAIGFDAGFPSDSSNVTGSMDSFVGSQATLGTGTLSNATAIGAQSEVAESNALVLGSIAGVNHATSSVSVGIGTTAPKYVLEVDAPGAFDAQMAMVSTGSDAAFAVKNTASGGREYWIDSGSGTAGVGAGNFAVYDRTASLTRLVVSSAGNVGIGTIMPDNLLSVNGSADKPGGGSWGTFSDGRLKNLNGSFNSGLSQVLKLNPVRYRYRPDNAMGIRDTDEHVGVVAQDVQRVIPEAVTENSKGYLLVNNDPIIWAMLNAIKEQQGQIKQQQNQLREQTAAMRSLKAEIRETRETLRKVKAQVADSQLKVVAAK